MNCIDYRRLITSDPAHVGAEGLRHRLACRSCAKFAAEAQAFDSQLRDALTVAVPPGLQSKVMLAASGRASRNRRRVAIAASLLVAVGASLFVLTNRSVDALPGHVIGHLYHEAELLVPTSIDAVPRQRLVNVLERTGVRLVDDVPDVIHAGVCLFRGHLVSHLVVNSNQGPVTVMLLPDEKVDRPMPIDEDGFRGTIVPVRGGSIAVVGTEGAYPAQRELERKFSKAVEWET